MMSFFSKTAFSTMRKNKMIYVPYLITASLMTMLYYILSSVQIMVAESGMSGSLTMTEILRVSRWVSGFLSLIFLFYINSFVMKRRSKEFGLFSVLGLEKGHLAKIVFWEILFTFVSSLMIGIFSGAILSQLMFLLLLYIVGIPSLLHFRIPFQAVGVTTILFAAGWLVVLLYSQVVVFRSEPIAFLQSAKEGEREPKSKTWVTLLGLLSLGAGYTLALKVVSPFEAIAIFFPAVMFVMLGTYCLFLSGSIALLKLLRRNKNFYYHPSNFISVSGMIYRMKRNAAGLASICILATAVLVTLSSTVCLYLGEEDMLDRQYPRDFTISSFWPADSPDLFLLLKTVSSNYTKSYGLEIQNEYGSIEAIESDNDEPAQVYYTFYFDLNQEPSDYAFYENMRESYLQSIPRLAQTESKSLVRAEFFQIYGSLLFVGVFFVALFLVTTVLIIYYKQITEGFDDSERFRIMQQVGLSHKEVKQTILQQILMVFFLPLLVAFVHISVAFPVLLKMLTVFGMTNRNLFLLCVMSSCAVFALFYGVIYRATAGAYYRIVQNKQVS